MVLARWWAVPGFLQTGRLAFRPKSSFFVSSVWPLYHTGLIGGVLQRGWSFWKVLLSSQYNAVALSEWPSGFLVTSLTKALLPRLLSLARRPAVGGVLVVPDFFHVRMIEASVLIGTFNAADVFLYPSPDLCLDTILSRRSTDSSCMAWFVLWHELKYGEANKEGVKYQTSLWDFLG